SSIQCYYCNSANNSACLDVNLYDDELRSRVIPVVNCETAITGPVAMPFFCLFHSSHEPEVRVTRGCGWVQDQNNKPCYRHDNSDLHETVCQCFSDHCNAADSTVPTTGVALFLVLAAVLYFYR
ncbi:hypothetical protein OBRU01_23577, partial [Operophtera brumata]